MVISSEKLWEQLATKLSTQSETRHNHQDYKPKVYSSSSPAAELEDLHNAVILDGVTYSEKPYGAAAEELRELNEFYEALFARLPNGAETTPQELMNYVLDTVTKILPDEEELILELLNEYQFIFTDTITFATAMISETALLADPLESRRLIYYKLNQELFLYVRKEAHELLRRSRLLGLVPFATLDTLQQLSIKVIGASVAAYTIDLLAAYGSSNIEFTDGGLLATSNGGRLPGEMGNIENLGASKATTLAAMLYKREPYANFVANHGTIQAHETGKPGEIPLLEYIKNAQLLIEVVDSAALKILFRIIIDGAQVEVPLLWIADISREPIAGIEGGKFFNQEYTKEHWQERLASILNSPERAQKMAGSLLAVTEMIQKELSAEHATSLTMTGLGIQPFWSQTPADSRASAATSVGLILSHIQGENIQGKNFTHGGLHSTAGLNPDQQVDDAQKKDLAMRMVQQILRHSLQPSL